MKSRGLLAAFLSVTILGIAVGCSQPVAALDGQGDDTKTDDGNTVTSKKAAPPAATTATTPPAATTATPAPAPTTTADAGTDASTGDACRDLQTCCNTITNPIGKFACQAASQAGDADTCAEVLQGCNLASQFPQQ